jgi:polar amino acid transport system substrate-binding protein
MIFLGSNRYDIFTALTSLKLDRMIYRQYCHSMSTPTISVLVLCLSLFFSEVQGNPLRFVGEHSAPFAFLDEQQPVGILVEIAEALIAETNLDASIELLPWARAYEIALTEPNVVLISLLKTSERAEHFQWLGKIHEAKASMFKLKKRSDIELVSLTQAKSLRVASVRGYGSSDFLLENGFVQWDNLILVTRPEQLWDMLYRDRVDLVLFNTEAGKYEAAQFGHDPDELITALPIPELTLGLFSATGLATSQETVKKLQTGLQNLQDDRTVRLIKQKWKLGDLK